MGVSARLGAVLIDWFGWRVFTMAKSKKKAESVFLVCKETGDYNYTLRRKPGGEKLSVKKYCPRLRKHTEHTEKKK
jgi:large subunit ribosomal protein L33